MGRVERTWSDLQADRFFAGFANATPELVAAIELERGGDLTAVVSESVGYWDRKMAARAARREARERSRRMSVLGCLPRRRWCVAPTSGRG